MEPGIHHFDHNDYNIFNLLCRINVSENYVANILKFQPYGKQIREEEIEDLSLFGIFVVRTSKAFSRRIKRYAQSRRTFATYQEILELQQRYPGQLKKELQEIKEGLSVVPAEERLRRPENRAVLPLETRLQILENRFISLSRLSRDGATFFDDQVVSKYVKIDATLLTSLRGFNLLYSRFFKDKLDDFEDIEPFFFPPTFSDSAGKDLQVGVKSANALGAALVLNCDTSSVESYLCKTTEYGNTGIGKVARMYWDRPFSFAEQLGVELNGRIANENLIGSFVYEEFFLYRIIDLPNLKDAPGSPPLSKEILDPYRGVVGIVRRYETDLAAPFKGKQLVPDLIHAKYVTGREIGLSNETLKVLERGPSSRLSPAFIYLGTDATK